MADSESTLKIISRKEAKRRGLRHYFTGRTCKRGHSSQRLVSTMQCCECLYVRLKSWRIANRETARTWDRAWKDANRERMNAMARSRYADNPEKHINKVKNWYRENSEYKRADRRLRYAALREASPALYEQVLEASRIRVRQWVTENPTKARHLSKASRSRRRARERNSAGAFSSSDVAQLYEAQGGKCVYCRCRLGDKYHVDHVIPLAKDGRNDRSNLQLLCGPCNLKKGSRDPVEYAASLGLLV